MEQQNHKSMDFMAFMFSSDCFKDVTLVCDDHKKIKAHRNVLSFFSPFFLKLFAGEGEAVFNKTVIFLKEIKHQHMEMILRFLYLGEAEVDEKQTTELLSASKTLEFDSFKRVLEEIHIKNSPTLPEISNSTPDNLVETKNKREENENENEPYDSMNFEEGLGRSKMVTIQNVQQCPQCYKVFSAERNLRNHLKNDHKELLDQSLVKKEALETSLKSTKQVKEKVKIILEKPSPIQCPVCQRSFSLQAKLKDHMESLHAPKDIQCELCDKCFSAQKSLNTHMDYSHKKQATFVCDECGNKYKQKGNLESHIAIVHKGIRLTCTYESCDLVCTAKGYLEKHIKIVHEGFRLKCDQCDYEAKSKQRLKEHEDKIHKELKPYKCKECDMTFSGKANLLRHSMAIHEKLRYQCSECDQTVTQYGDLKRHFIKVHQKKLPPGGKGNLYKMNRE